MREHRERDADEDRPDRSRAGERGAEGRPERGAMYEHGTSMGSTGQEGWQGGYDLPAPGQSGQQQDYVSQQRYAGEPVEPDDDTAARERAVAGVGKVVDAASDAPTGTSARRRPAPRVKA